ncbi:MAG: hypothetical protein RLY43_2120 [Bacteroidota bacterium]|jgi:uncharacterized membrane protein (UPF0127 family)
MSDFVIINKYKFPTIVAVSSLEQQQGLMNIINPPIMSFPGRKKIKSFWMKDTPSSLDLIFACDGLVVDRKFGAPYSLDIITSQHPADLVVEFPHGILDHFPVNIGDPINLSLSIKTVAKIYNSNLLKQGDL